ncbi:hypothetical protein HELRODRAFT_181276 [Helobdella robusta]|uniref:Uncharacterized protein n=1 Tax=Helobdella robusta TaxID=6412 RepID=T1FGU2_HELRO|nr:hypothetical protein HELRODRAFT_181276 [Helobdella robusta]ESN93167.1 hypothetical protein HELRODRAFT_181276 [Helobdella robusta]
MDDVLAKQSNNSTNLLHTFLTNSARTMYPYDSWEHYKGKNCVTIRIGIRVADGSPVWTKTCPVYPLMGPQCGRNTCPVYPSEYCSFHFSLPLTALPAQPQLGLKDPF